MSALHLVICVCCTASITSSQTNASHAIQPSLPRNACGVQQAARWQAGLDGSRKRSHGEDCGPAHTGLPGDSKRAATAYAHYSVPAAGCQESWAGRCLMALSPSIMSGNELRVTVMSARAHAHMHAHGCRQTEGAPSDWVHSIMQMVHRRRGRASRRGERERRCVFSAALCSTRARLQKVIVKANMFGHRQRQRHRYLSILSILRSQLLEFVSRREHLSSLERDSACTHREKLSVYILC